MSTVNKEILEKWDELLEDSNLPKIADPYRKGVIAQLLENQEIANGEELPQILTESNQTGVANVANWDPVLIGLVRRAMPNLIAFDTAGVQPMNQPTGLIFALRSLYKNHPSADTEALFNEADTAFSGTGEHVGDSSANVPGDPDEVANGDPLFSYGVAMSTTSAETLGTQGNPFGEMGFKIEKSTVTAKSRGLKAEYTLELAQDLKRVHGLEAETELSNILSTEILAEINREFIRTVNAKAKLGLTGPGVNVINPGIFDLAVDADGRWIDEKFKSLAFEIDREANEIAKSTRRGKGNWIICSSNVASAMSMTGRLTYTPAMANNLEVDDTGNTFAGIFNGRMKVYIDPYAVVDYVTVGYRGSNPYDAGIFYCPYIPLGILRATDQDTFQPKIGFKTRYGMITNPFNGASPADDTGVDRENIYFRIFRVDNINVGTGIAS